MPAQMAGNIIDVHMYEKGEFLSDNPRFCRSALSRYTPRDFMALLEKHHIAFHEKHKGQLFCDRSAEDIIQMLLAECATGNVTRWQPCSIKAMICRYSLSLAESSSEPACSCAVACRAARNALAWA